MMSGQRFLRDKKRAHEKGRRDKKKKEQERDEEGTKRGTKTCYLQ